MLIFLIAGAVGGAEPLAHSILPIITTHYW
jgi:hypothetical protein